MHCSALYKSIAAGIVQLTTYITAANGFQVTYEGKTYTPLTPFKGGGWKPSTWPVGVWALFPDTIDLYYRDWVIFTIGNVNRLILYKPFKLPRIPFRLVVQAVAVSILAKMLEGFLENLKSSTISLADEITVDLVFEKLLGVVAITAAAYGGVALVKTVNFQRLVSQLATASLTLRIAV